MSQGTKLGPKAEHWGRSCLLSQRISPLQNNTCLNAHVFPAPCFLARMQRRTDSIVSKQALLTCHVPSGDCPSASNGEHGMHVQTVIGISGRTICAAPRTSVTRLWSPFARA